ncbi:unnamed protein product [Rotaria sordida]|uniref:Uncharacterized protein n=1 Tax=Rotaria sordida TaxID=392033 RepID=A0A815D3Q0_9BILA|nr:unnamed protein product [Rotaria sordida]CAF1292482.1 unnamed protein product [Rotaria sordida]CAF3666005.1 unnamed protein product [Rotaria sordida]CAF3826149.1 unnamed protein product [Rotaria sordida]
MYPVKFSNLIKDKDELYAKVKQAYVDVNIPAVYPAANKQLQQRLSDFVSKGLTDEQSMLLFDKVNSNRVYALEKHENLIRLIMLIKEKDETKKLIVLPIDEEIKVVVSSFIHIYEQTGFIESSPKCYERLHNIYAISNKRIRIVQRTLAKFIVSPFVNDENENEKTEDDTSRDDKIEYDKSNDETIDVDENHDEKIKHDKSHDGKIKYDKSNDETIEIDENHDEKIRYDKSHDDKIEYDKSNDEAVEDDDKKCYKQHRNVLKVNQIGNVHISSPSTSHVSINTRSKTKLRKNQNIRSSESDFEADKRKKMKRRKY